MLCILRSLTILTAIHLVAYFSLTSVYSLTMSRTVHCHISGLLELDSITGSSPFLTSIALIHGVPLSTDDSLSIPVNLTYYNSTGDQFSHDTVIFCSEFLLITKSSNDHSQLSIKTHFLIKFVSDTVLIFDHFTDLYQIFRWFWKDYLYWWSVSDAFFHSQFYWSCYLSFSE